MLLLDSHDTPGPGHDLDEVPVDIRKKKDIEEEESYDMVDTPHPPPPAPIKGEFINSFQFCRFA